MRRTITAYLLLSLAGSLFGQDFDKIRPRELPRVETPDVRPEYKPAARELDDGRDTVLVDAITRLVFFRHFAEQQPMPDLSALEYRDNVGVLDLDLIDNDEFRRRVQHYLGLPITQARINEITRSIYLYYEDIGRPIINVTIPPQDITEGALIFAVLEANLGELSIEGAKYFSGKRILKQIDINSGDPIIFPELQKDLDWINRNPFLTVRPVVTPGEGFGLTNLNLLVEDKLPVYAYSGYEDTGSQSSSLDRWFVGAQFGNLFNRGHSGSFQATTNGDISEYRILSGVYRLPLPWRHEVAFIGSNAETSTGNAANAVLGESRQAGLRYSIPTHDWRGWKRRFEFGADYKFTNTDFDLGGDGTLVGIEEVTTLQTSAMVSLNRADRNGRGATSLKARIYVGRKDINPDESATSISDVMDNYAYVTFDFKRDWRLPGDWTITNEFSWQQSSTTLPPGETFGLGGYDTVRGYDNRIISTDNGYYLRNELRMKPIVHALPLVGKLKPFDKLPKAMIQPLVFYDYGVGRDSELLAQAPDDYNLGAGGVGFRYSLGRHMNMRFDYAWQVNTLPQQDTNQRAHLAVMLSY